MNIKLKEEIRFSMRFRGAGGRGKLTRESGRILVRVEGASTPMGDSTWPWWATIDTTYTDAKWAAACEYLEERIPARSLWDIVRGVHWLPFIGDPHATPEEWLEFRGILVDEYDEYDEDWCSSPFARTEYTDGDPRGRQKYPEIISGLEVRP